MMVRLIVAMFLSLSALTLGTASSDVHMHPVSQASPPMIDGALHPELIPDSLAYRLYLVALSVPGNSVEADRTRQQNQLAQMGLREDEQEIVRTIVTDFRSNYEAAIAQYNQKATSVSGFNQAADAPGETPQVV
jgi:hypothetical protein